jgi:hypothetical protein
MRETVRTRISTTFVILAMLVCGSTRVEAAPLSGAEDCATTATTIESIEAFLASAPRPVPIAEFFLSLFEKAFADDCVRLNEIQSLGSHNSYHVQPSPKLLDFMMNFDPMAEAWEYTHLPIAEQFETQGVRQIELDVYNDPDGGAYFFRLGGLLVGEGPWAPFLMLAPGMKVLHVDHLDFETTCISLIECLQGVKGWSAANPGHLPIMVLIEAKQGLFENEEGVPIVAGFGSSELDAVDAEIRSVFSEAEMLTPDDVRGGFATLEEAILTEGWPTLGEARGQVMFALDNTGSERTAYLAGHPTLEGRVMFTSSNPGQPSAGFVKVNDPIGSGSQIPDLVADGYLVRTRADVDTQQARNGDTTQRDAALASGAQFVSSDYPEPDPDPGFTDYFVEIPAGAPSRCNPVAVVDGCRNDALESLD